MRGTLYQSRGLSCGVVACCVGGGTSGSGMKVYVVYLRGHFLGSDETNIPRAETKEIDPEWRVRQAPRQTIGKQVFSVVLLRTQAR